MNTLEQALERDARAVSGEEPYEVMWQIELEGDDIVFIPRRRVQPGIADWENEGGR